MESFNKKQTETKEKIQQIAESFGVDPSWAASVAMVESSLGLHQKSPTGCRGVFQMSGIAMKDLLYEMENVDDDLIDIACGILFLRLLLKRWGTMRKATEHYCDPNDRHFYMNKVEQYRDIFEGQPNETFGAPDQIEERVAALEKQCCHFHAKFEKLSLMRAL